MKIRQGFVSNSSSSSFLVCFPKIPKTVEELQEMLFGKKAFLNGSYGDENYPARMISEIVFKDLQTAKQATFEHIVEELFANSDPYYYPDGPKYPDYGGDDWNEKYKKYKAEQAEWANKKAVEYLKANPGYYYEFEYSDNDGLMYAAMEHGDLFENLPHLVISHH